MLLFCCYAVVTFLEQKLLSWPFLGQLTDFSLISLKIRFLLFSLKWKRFPVLVQNCNVLTFFRTGNSFELFEGNQVVLTSISTTTTFFFSLEICTLFSSIARKTLFVLVCCCYGGFTFIEQKLLSQVFLGQLTDFSLISLKRKVFAFSLLNYAVFSFLARDKGSGLFAGNHNDSYFILLQTKFFSFCC